MRRSERNKILDDAIDMLDKMEVKYPKRFEIEMNKIAESVIDDWYDSYSRHIYDPSLSLFHTYKIINNNKKCSVRFSPKFMSGYSHHQDNSIIYQNSFIEGYHGGSTGNGLNSNVPHWRTPYPFYPKWGNPSVKTFSPYERMYDEMSKSIKDMENDFNKDKAKVMKKLRRIMGRRG